MADSKSDWERVEPLLDRALDLEDSQRREFLDEVGSDDPALMQRLLELLQATEEPDLMIDRPLHAVARGLVEKVPIEKLDPALAPGRMVGVYRIVEEIGEGGMGRVFLAERADGEYRQRVALKVLNEQADVEAESYSRFRRERQILADLRHPGIARLLDGGVTADGRPYFVLEYVDGVPLVEYCERRQLPIDERVQLLVQVCEALHYAHQRGVVHRDLKPSNLLVEDDPERGRRVCVLDFGIAHHGRPSEITLTGQIMGTPGYMSPEQAKGLTHLVDRRCDVFALGIVLYELITGRQPFGGGSDSAAEVLLAIAEASFEPIRGPLPEVGEDLEAIVERCLAKEPEDRYDSMRALGADLERYLAGRSLAVRTGLIPSVRAALQRRSLGWPLAVAALLLTIVGVVSWRGVAEARHRRAADEHLEAALQISNLARRAHLSEVGDLRATRGEIELRVATVQGELDRAAPRVGAAAHYVLGIAALELGAALDAIEHLSATWEGGLRTDEVASSLVAAAAERRGLVSSIVDLSGASPLPEALPEGLRSQLAAVLAAGGGGVPNELAEAQRAWLDGRHRDVLEQVQEATAREPWRYESLLLASDSAVELAREAAEESERRRWSDQAARALEAAAEQGRSDPRVYDRLCALGLARTVAGGGARTEALEPCRRSLRLDPLRYEPQLLIALGTLRLGGEQEEGADEEGAEEEGQAARPDLARAAEAVEVAARLAPDDPLVALVGGFVEQRRAAGS